MLISNESLIVFMALVRRSDDAEFKKDFSFISRMKPRKPTIGIVLVPWG